MTTATTPRWESMRTDETRMVEDTLKKAGFEQVGAYRYNSAVIRLRVVDPRFEGLKMGDQITLIEPHLESLPDRTQGDIMSILTIAPSELGDPPGTHRWSLRNVEFDDPSPSEL